MRVFGVLLLTVLSASAQNQTGRVEGVVTDAVSHQPVKKASVLLQSVGLLPSSNTGQSSETQNSPRSAATDASGGFAFDDLPAGRYQLHISHSNYPEARFGGVWKAVQVVGGETAGRVNVELLPGAAITGHILDEDGDPLRGCYPQLQAVKASQGAQYGGSRIAEDGSYRLSGIRPGKYFLIVECHADVFQSRPLSAGPDPPPVAAYAPQYYPAARDVKSAEVLDLSPGTEKSALDFQMSPAPVTHVFGKIAGDADWRGHDVEIRLQSVKLQNERFAIFGPGARVDPESGAFDIVTVFPGSYKLVAFTQPTGRGGQRESEGGSGAVTYVQVADKPVEVNLQFHSALEIHGQIQIEPSKGASDPNPLTGYIIQLEGGDNMFSQPFARVAEDGSFVLKSIFPGHSRIRLQGPNGFLKSASYGGIEVKNGELDLTSGSAAPLQIVVGTNMATIQGTAPAGLGVAVQSPEDNDSTFISTSADAGGHFVFRNLAPGKYRVIAMAQGVEIPDEGGQEVTVAEGETATVDVRASDNP